MDRPPHGPARATDFEVAYRSLEAAYQQIQSLHTRLRFAHSRMASRMMQPVRARRVPGLRPAEPPRLLADLEAAARGYVEAVERYEELAERMAAEGGGRLSGARR